MGKPDKTKPGKDPGAAAMAALMASSPAATKAWLDIFSESSRFVTDRLQHDMETQKALLACKTPAELLQVQSSFFKTAMEQYADEANRLFKMMSKATEDTLKEAQSGLSREYDDVPL